MSAVESLSTGTVCERVAIRSYTGREMDVLASAHLSPSLSEMAREGLVVEPNRDRDAAVWTQTYGQEAAFDIDGGSAGFAVNLPHLEVLAQYVSPPREPLNALQKWEGFVISVGPDTFRARLKPIVGEGHDQDAEILVEEVDAEDRPLVKPGAVFYWSIGYLEGNSGRMRVSVIRFRRLPSWSHRELETARAEADRLRETLLRDGDPSL